MTKRVGMVLGTLMTAAMLSPASAEELQKLSIVMFGPPSLGAFLPPVIKAQKLDEKNGLSITFEERTPDAYTAQFNSGEFQLGGSAALLTVGLADISGVKVTYLFNLFDYWGAVVTSRPEIKSLRDIEGKDLAAAKGTTNYVMFDWFARQLGADTSQILGGQHGDAGARRLCLGGSRDGRPALGAGLHHAAFQEAGHQDHRSRDRRELAEHSTGSKNIPYLGVAAHIDWAEKNKTADSEAFCGLQGSRRVGRRRTRTRRRS